MKPASAKAKGRALQNKIRELILEHFPSLEPDDVKCAVMGESGQDIHLSPAAARQVPFAIEAKNQERLDLWGSLKQAEEHSKKTGREPLLVFKRNRTKVYAALELRVLLELLVAANNNRES